MGKVPVLIGELSGLGRLPGDIVIERESGRFYIPVASSIVVSAVLSLIYRIFSR